VSQEDILSEILEGVSPLANSGETIFFKHPTIREKIKDFKIIEECKKDGAKKGIKSEEQLIQTAIRSHSWSEENEDKIKDLQWLIEKSESSISKLSDPNLITHNQQTVDGYKKELNDLNKSRSKIVNTSLENYSLSRSHIIFCKRDCFYIKKGKKKNLTEGFPKQILWDYIRCYSKLSNRDNLIKAAYNSYFFDLVYMSKSPLEIFPDPLKKITIFQKDLLFYGNILSSKIKNMEIPDSITKDAIALYNFKPEDKSKKDKDFRTRNFVQSKGGLEKMKPEDKL
tara:strand:+ start:1987 stop:2835 length:849 start_codon:yes stop_codon:yes gene_type:complete